MYRNSLYKQKFLVIFGILFILYIFFQINPYLILFLLIIPILKFGNIKNKILKVKTPSNHKTQNSQKSKTEFCKNCSSPVISDGVFCII